MCFDHPIKIIGQVWARVAPFGRELWAERLRAERLLVSSIVNSKGCLTVNLEPLNFEPE